MSEKMTFTGVRGVGHLAALLLTTPVNPKAAPADWKRMSNEDILIQLKLAFPNRKPTTHTLAWYTSRLSNDPAYRAKNGGKEPLAGPSKTAKTIEVTIAAPSVAPAATVTTPAVAAKK